MYVCKGGSSDREDILSLLLHGALIQSNDSAGWPLWPQEIPCNGTFCREPYWGAMPPGRNLTLTKVKFIVPPGLRIPELSR